MRSWREPAVRPVGLEDREQRDRDAEQKDECEHRQIEAAREHLDDHARRSRELAQRGLRPGAQRGLVVPRLLELVIGLRNRRLRAATRARDRAAVAEDERHVAGVAAKDLDVGHVGCG